MNIEPITDVRPAGAAGAGSSRSRLMMLGLWTKPPLLQHNQFFSQSDQLPTLEQLSARLAMHLPGVCAGQDDTAQHVSVAQLMTAVFGLERGTAVNGYQCC